VVKEFSNSLSNGSYTLSNGFPNQFQTSEFKGCPLGKDYSDAGEYLGMKDFYLLFVHQQYDTLLETSEKSIL
jgi:hypothetical protein